VFLEDELEEFLMFYEVNFSVLVFQEEEMYLNLVKGVVQYICIV